MVRTDLMSPIMHPEDHPAMRALSPPRRQAGTRALIGRHSRDRLVSVFLAERKLFSQDGGKWPDLAGLLTVDPVGAKQLLLQKYVPYAEVQCILLYRTALGAVVEKVLYNQNQELTETEAHADDSTLEGTQPGRRRYPFKFDFGNQALPPSFCFDPKDLYEGVPIGLHWEVVGYLGQKVLQAGDGMASLSMDSAGNMTDVETYSVRKQSPVSLNFLVEHRHTATGLALPPMTATQTLRPSLFSFAKSSQPETIVTANLERPLCSSEDPLKVQIELNKLNKSQRVQRVRLTAKQIITIRLPTTQQLQYKATIAKFEDAPAPRYDPASNNQFTATYQVAMGKGILDKPKKGKSPAQLLPLDFMKEPEQPVTREFVASTPLVKPSSNDAWGLEVKYILKVEVTLADSSGTFGTRERELDVSLPFVLTGVPKDEIQIAAHPPQVARRDSTSSDTVPTKPDALLPLLAETLDDLEQSVTDVAVLRTEWRNLRSESSNCTRSSDHAQEILDILASLDVQLKVFADSYSVRDGAVRWPKNPVPFNMLVLETELLARAVPDELTVNPSPAASSQGVSVVDMVLLNMNDFFLAGKAVVIAWIASRGGGRDEKEAEEFRKKVDVLENAANRLQKGLEDIVAGADQDRGRTQEEKEEEKLGESGVAGALPGAVDES